MVRAFLPGNNLTIFEGLATFRIPHGNFNKTSIQSFWSIQGLKWRFPGGSKNVFFFSFPNLNYKCLKYKGNTVVFLYGKEEKKTRTSKNWKFQVSGAWAPYTCRALWSCQLLDSFVSLQDKVTINFITVISYYSLNNSALKDSKIIAIIQVRKWTQENEHMAEWLKSKSAFFKVWFFHYVTGRYQGHILNEEHISFIA